MPRGQLVPREARSTMTTSCKRASELISAAMDRELNARELLSLRVHLLICSYCRRFRRQLEVLRRLVCSPLTEGDGDLPGAVALTVEARDRIRRALLEVSP